MADIVLLLAKDFNFRKNEIFTRLIQKKELSSASMMKVNKVHGLTSDTYSILYTLEEFKKLQPMTIFRHIMKVIEGSFADEEITFSFLALNLGETDSDTDDRIFALDEFFSSFELPNVEYETSSTLIEHLGEKYYYTEDENENIVTKLSKADKKKKKKKKKKQLSKFSKLVDDGKKSIKAHNIIVSNKGKDFRHDVKILKNFLKDFIPQKTKWAKRYRNELLSRWMGVFVITPKMAKKIKKANKSVSFTRKRPNCDELFYDATK